MHRGGITKTVCQQATLSKKNPALLQLCLDTQETELELDSKLESIVDDAFKFLQYELTQL